MRQGDQPAEAHDPFAVVGRGGEMGDRTATFDWSKTPVGPTSGWPHSLKSVVRVMLDSRYAMWLGWGPELTFFYNDAYARMTLGPKHPWALGRPAREVWSEIWSDIGPRTESVVRTGHATWDEGLLLFLERQGFREETYHTFSYSPVPDDAGGVGGMLCVVTEDTERTIGERRLRALRELGTNTIDKVQSAEEACRTAARTLADNAHDLPFALIYLLDPEAPIARLAGAAGLKEGAPGAPTSVDLSDSKTAEAGWPMRAVLESGEARLTTRLKERFGPMTCGVWSEPPHQALVLPLTKPGQARLAGFIVAGISPRLLFDDDYKGFLDLMAGQIATAIANARAYEEERKRVEAFTELDRAKTTFFSNVSHEFRTPLTLMLAPLQEALSQHSDSLPPAVREDLSIAHRNSLRLLKLVNTLLDFSRIEAARVQPNHQPTDLSAMTCDLASVFRSAVERAGMRLVLDCPPLDESVFVDRDMWEKIVLNLLSNALKYTFEGEITVALHRVGDNAQLTVRDTGTGIPADELPRLFERFHRIQGARARTHEGTGIGLALVHELVKLHGGAIRVESQVDRGSTFIVTVPLGKKHLPLDRIGTAAPLRSTAIGTTPYLEEALRWLPGESMADLEPVGESQAAIGESATTSARKPSPGRVLIADDNEDMREYLRRLLAAQYEVEVVGDGKLALDAARRHKPDAILTDVMMPHLDGFGLLREVRADAALREIPIIMLSARAGEEARVEGARSGADDYLVKPFSARELLARVGALVETARVRREALLASHEQRRVFELIARGESRQHCLEEICESIRRIDANVRGCLLIANADRTRCAEAIAPHIPSLADRIRHQAIEERANEPWSQALRGQAIVCPDVAHDSRWSADWKVFCQQQKILAACFAPAVDVEGAPAAAVLLCFDSPKEPTDRDQRTIDMATTALGVLLRREQSERALRERKKELESANAQLQQEIEARKANAVTEARLSAIIESSDDAIVSKTLDGIIQSWNAGAQALFGYTPQEIIGKSILMIVPPERYDEEATILRRLKNGERINHFETQRLAKDGRRREISLSVSPIRDATGTIVGASKIARDISDKKRAEREKEDLLEAERQAREEAQRVNRLKDEFLATLSHELRTPLNAIMGWAQMMGLGTMNGDEMKEAGRIVERNARTQKQLIDDLLDMSRIISGKLRLELQQLEPVSFIEAAIETIRPAAMAKEIRLEKLLDPVAGPISGDPARLQQVMWNLLSNAVKFTPKGGKIQVRLERVNSQIELSVSDTGQGIDPAFLPHLFERFRQADSSISRKHGGLGLGLAIVKEIVELHGGTVYAKSAGEGKGASFVVDLPVLLMKSRPEPKRVHPTAPSAIPMDAGLTDLTGLKVLFVDDEPDARGLVKRLLIECGAHVTTAESATQALGLIGDCRPDVLISDIGMPEIDGYEFLRKLRMQTDPTSKVPAIALTAFARSEDRTRALRAGYISHVAKPIEPSELLATIAVVVGRVSDHS